MSEHQTAPELIIACDINAISAEVREQHFVTAHTLFASVLEVREMPGGYGFHLPAESATLIRAAEFISNERLCCPFFAFTLRLEPPNAALWLELTGNDDVKLFVRAEIGTLLSSDVAHAAGFER